jgi:ABC-type multidrug transport system fused ATPase/permease subunit
LDAESEYQVQKAIDDLVESRERTMIVVAHRLSTIKNCDRIFVLKNGEIMEEGTHESLLREEGIYKNLVDKQLSHYTKR